MARNYVYPVEEILTALTRVYVQGEARRPVARELLWAYTDVDVTRLKPHKYQNYYESWRQRLIRAARKDSAFRERMVEAGFCLDPKTGDVDFNRTYEENVTKPFYPRRRGRPPEVAR